MPRLPEPGGDEGSWGSLLNEYLSTSHLADGTLKDIPQSKVSGLSASLSGKANTSHVHAIADVTNLTTTLSGKADTAHNHDSRYYTKTETIPVIVLDEGDSVPAGTPVGTVILYRSA